MARPSGVRKREHGIDGSGRIFTDGFFEGSSSENIRYDSQYRSLQSGEEEILYGAIRTLRFKVETGVRRVRK